MCRKSIIKYDVKIVQNQDDFDSAFRELFNTDHDENSYRAYMTSEFIIALSKKIGDKKTFDYLCNYFIKYINCTNYFGDYDNTFGFIKVLKWAKPIKYINKKGISISRPETIKLINLIIDNEYYFNNAEVRDELIGFVEEIYNGKIITDGKYDFIVEKVEKVERERNCEYMIDYIEDVKSDRRPVKE